MKIFKNSKKDNNSKERDKIKLSIFIKLLLILLLISIVPAVVCFFLTLFSYQDIIEIGIIQEYLPRGEAEVEKQLFDAQKEIRLQATILLLAVIFVISIICFLVSRGFTKPVRELFKGTEEVARGNLMIRIKKHSQDEVGELVDAFNKMVEDIRKSREELEEAKHALEIKVRARTKELKDLTENLEQKVESRTKRLQEKVEELENFKRLAEEQEIKIKELEAKTKKRETTNNQSMTND